MQNFGKRWPAGLQALSRHTSISKRDGAWFKNHALFIKVEKKNTDYFIFYTLYWMAIACLNPYLSLILTNKGMDGIETGTTLSVFNVVSVLASLLISYKVDKTNKPAYYLRLLSYGIICSVSVLYFVRTHWILAIIVMLYGFCTSPTNDIVDRSLMVELEDNPQRYSTYRLGGPLGFGIGMVLSALILKYTTIDYLFLVFVVVMIVNMYFTKDMITVNIEKHELEAINIKKNFIAAYKYVPYLLLALFGIGEAGINQYLALHLLELDYAIVYVSIFIGLSMIGEFTAFLFLHRIIGRFGVWPVISFGFLIQSLRLISLVNIPHWHIVVTCIIQMLGGASFALVYSSVTQIVSINSEKGARTIAQSLKTVANRGIGQGLGSMLFGVMLQYYTISLGFRWIAVLSFIVFLIVLSFSLFNNYRLRERG